MTGFKANVYSQIGASNHVAATRQDDDFYTTDPVAVEALLKKLQELKISVPATIIETSVGAGHIAHVFERYGCKVEAYDIVDRGYPGTIVQDFLSLDKLRCKNEKMFVQNPPYKQALEFIKRSLDFCRSGEYVCALLKIQFLESIKRYDELFRSAPPKYIVVFSRRTTCLKEGKVLQHSSAMCFAWFIWQKGYTGFPRVTWCNVKALGA